MNYEEKIDKVRDYFDEHKAERYPFVNALLAEKDDYIKSLYFRMLCMLIRYTDEPNEMQSLYIRRLIAGANTENTLQDYMKMAIDVETKDIEDFLSIISEDKLKYYFCIDAMILLTVVSNEKNFELLAELVEMLGITEDELNYLAGIASSVCLQDSDKFDEAKSLATDSTKSLDLYHYVSGFYTGAVVNTPQLVHITSPDKSQIDLSEYGIFSSEKVIIENIESVMGECISLQGCGEVTIKNCKLQGIRNYDFKVEKVDTVIIENCDISDFTDRFARFYHVDNIIICGCRFRNCGCTSSSDIRGGVIYADYSKTVKLEANELRNCYVARSSYKSNYWATGIFFGSDNFGGSIEVNNNKFVGCECRNNGTNYASAYIAGSFSAKSEQNNICSGTNVKQIFVRN